MTVRLNHTIVRVRDKQESATFLAEILGLPEPTPYGPFLVVQVDNDVSLDYADDHGPTNPQHYAFLVGETEFDEIFDRIEAETCRIGLTPASAGRVSSTRTTADAASIGKIPAGISWRSSPAHTAAEADTGGILTVTRTRSG